MYEVPRHESEVKPSFCSFGVLICSGSAQAIEFCWTLDQVRRYVVFNLPVTGVTCLSLQVKSFFPDNGPILCRVLVNLPKLFFFPSLT